MTKIRQLFHRIGNLHNKISVGAGITKAELKHKFKDTPAARKINKALDRLSELERITVEASKDLRSLKDIIYKKINPDTEKPKGG